MKKFKILIFTIFLFISVIVIKDVYAQDYTKGLVAAPPYLSENVGEGVKLTEDIRVSNHRDTDENLIVESREVSIDENGNFYLPAGFENDYTSTFEKNGWLTFTPKEFFLRSGESQMVHVEVQIPSGLPTQGYYLDIAISTKPSESKDLKVGLTPEIVIPIAINYIGKGGEIRELEIVSFKTDKVFYEYLPVNFITHITNKGNVHLIPVGQIFVSRDKQFQDNIASIQFNESNQRIFYNAGRIFENKWEEGFLVKEEGKLQINWQKLGLFRIGKYYAQLNLAWDGETGKKFVTAETSFWVFPWKLFLIIVGIILLFVFIRKSRKYLKDRKNRGVNKYMQK